MEGWEQGEEKSSGAVVINDFYTKTGAWEGAHQLLTHLAVFALVVNIFRRPPVFSAVDANSLHLEWGLWFPLFCAESLEVEQRLRLHVKVSSYNIFELYLRTLVPGMFR
jgi:hypothetical protein